MVDLDDLKQAISKVVKTNYNKEITGAQLQDLLIYLVNQLYGNDTELNQAIDSIEIGGVRLKSEFGQSQVYGLTQKFLTEIIKQLQQSITTQGQDIEQLQQDIQDAGKVDDVKVNGHSVLDPQTKTADIPVPTKVSELVNDSGFVTTTEAQTMVDETKITEAEVTMDDQVGTPSATASVVGQKLILAFQNIMGDGIVSIQQTTISQESGGTNIVTVTTKGGKVGTFQVKNGEKGDTVILGEDVEYTLYNSTGSNTDGAMTQKAATKSFANIANADGADFFVIDDDGNVIIKSKNGHIQTKYFDSSKDATSQQRGLMSASDKIKLDNLKFSDIEGSSVDDNSNLVLCDENGYVILRLENGHIKTKYFDSSQAEQIYGDKKIVFIGDSITAGVAGVTGSLYHQIIASKTGWTCVNKGVGGTGYARYISGGANFLSRYQSAIDGDEDLIVIWGGTNDYGSDIADNVDAPLFGNIENPSDETTFCGAVNSLYKGLYLNFPWIPKLVITPIRRNVNPGGSAAQVQGSGDNPNKEGKTLSDYASAIKYFAAKYMIPVLDMYEEGEMPIDADSSLVPIYTRAVGGYAGDGLHPNKTAHEKIIAPKVLQKICQIFNIR